MEKQLKFQSKITCKYKGEDIEFLSNPLYVSYKDEINMKNLYTYEKYLEKINCNCECREISLLEYLSICIKNLFSC